MSGIGVALVGTGFMGQIHAEALKRLDIPVRGVLGSTPEKSQIAAERWGIPRAYASFEEVLADTNVQSVHLVVPNRWHFEMAARALQAGKHVMCEKPLAMNSRESAELVSLAKQHGNLAAAVNYNIRFYPLCLEARERITRGDLGQVFHVSGSYFQDWLLRPTDYNWRVLAEEGGQLRAVADIGTHWLDLIQALTGLKVAAVLADLNIVHPIRQRPKGEVETFQSVGQVEREPVPITTEDHGAILLRFSGGARGSLSVSQVSAGRKNCLRFEIAGAEQSLNWNSEEPNQLWIGHREQPNQILLRDPALLSPSARNAASTPGGHNEGYADTFKQCFRSFYEYISRGDFSSAPPFPTFADGHREILICEAILKSHHSQSWIPLEEHSP
jgi:predicted dehydrogenase